MEDHKFLTREKPEMQKREKGRSGLLQPGVEE